MVTQVPAGSFLMAPVSWELSMGRKAVEASVKRPAPDFLSGAR